MDCRFYKSLNALLSGTYIYPCLLFLVPRKNKAYCLTCFLYIVTHSFLSILSSPPILFLVNIMLIAISGSQGSGKTTILNELNKLGHNIIKRKTARSILNDWNVTLENVYQDLVLNQDFHEELLYRKHIDENTAIESTDIFFTERTYADIFTYALVSFGQHNKYSAWLDNYFLECSELNRHYNKVFYIKHVINEVEIDGVRSTNLHYSRLINSAMYDTNIRMINHEKLLNIEFNSVANRINFIINEIKN